MELAFYVIQGGVLAAASAALVLYRRERAVR